MPFCLGIIRMELPPRTRRILQTNQPEPKKLGTTSAHAENTCNNLSTWWAWRNYLRARGEYWWVSYEYDASQELPPRTRRIPHPMEVKQSLKGTTSAHAENTIALPLCHSRFRNYLRARGEYSVVARAPWRGSELPPRTRRIPSGCRLSIYKSGTTSAHAENTYQDKNGEVAHRNYLRARGEYFYQYFRAKNFWELPPRTRRIPDESRAGLGSTGTTSAHAENTVRVLRHTSFPLGTTSAHAENTLPFL